MYRPNIFMVLTPYDKFNKAASAFQLEHNSRWFYEATGGTAATPAINSRETTPSKDHEDSAIGCLVVSFDELLKLNDLQGGLKLASNPDSSHILLGRRGMNKISGEQCKITVSKDLRIWLHDYKSTYGTAVGLNGENQNEFRRQETWILAYAAGTTDLIHSRTIHCGSTEIEIQFPNHEASPPGYLAHLQEFARKTQEQAGKSKRGTSTGLRRIRLDSERQSEASSVPVARADKLLYYSGSKIGEGAFGEVGKIIRGRDGKIAAAKLFRPPPNMNKRQRDEPGHSWLIGIRREYELMRDNPHPNVVEVFEFRESPVAMMIMPYYSHGNMREATFLDDNKYKGAMGQILDALGYLHSRKVAHRDLKPENVLVEMDPRFKVVIADFGIANEAKDTAMLHTFGGTPGYMAPEVFPHPDTGHGLLVDIWSLGVMVLEWTSYSSSPPDLPETTRNEENAIQLCDWSGIWTTLLHKKLRDQEPDQIIRLLVHMIEPKVEIRWSARQCLLSGLKSGLFKRRLIDGLVICGSDRDDPAEEVEDGATTPTAASPAGLEPSLSAPATGLSPEITMIPATI
ncbi:MAG: hypothetical protein Q9163_001588 [Psora crenata]